MLAEKSIANHVVNVQQIGYWIGILVTTEMKYHQNGKETREAFTRECLASERTLDRLAVKMTTSNRSPIRFRNVSTWGRLETYT